MQTKKIEIEYPDTPENNKELLKIQKDYKSKISKLPSVIKKIEELGFILNSENIYEKKLPYIRAIFSIIIDTSKDTLGEIICITYSINKDTLFEDLPSTYTCNVIFTEQKNNNFLNIILYNGKKEKYTYRTENIKNNISQVLNNLLILESTPMEIGTIVRNLVKGIK